MIEPRVKLYRGIAESTFHLLQRSDRRESQKSWKKILQERAKENLSYLYGLESEIQKLHRFSRLQRQYFTDNKKIAFEYASGAGGSLIELEVPVSHILKKFRLEFQNFSKRKKEFEIVYIIDAAELNRFQMKWKLKVKHFNEKRD